MFMVDILFNSLNLSWNPKISLKSGKSSLESHQSPSKSKKSLAHHIFSLIPYSLSILKVLRLIKGIRVVNVVNDSEMCLSMNIFVCEISLPWAAYAAYKGILRMWSANRCDLSRPLNLIDLSRPFDLIKVFPWYTVPYLLQYLVYWN